MRANNIKILAISSILVISAACGTKKPVPETMIGIKETVARLDSAVTSIYGWEPRDSTYNHSVDTMVRNLLTAYEEARPDAPKQEKTEYAIEQDAYDQARITWNKFKNLIDDDKYEEALDFYFGKGEKREANGGDFLVFLKHSTQRFVFLSQVLYPMMMEYKEKDFAIEEYINSLKFEKAMGDLAISTQAETTGYVPETYPNVITELGSALVSVGKMDEAQGLFNDYINAIYLRTGDALYANFCGTYYDAYLYLQDKKPVWALGVWDNFLDYLDENKSDYDPKELKKCIAKIEEEKAKIQN